MEPPPLPSSSGRFRLRVQIYPPNDAYNLNAVPLRQFTIVKTPALALPDLTLQELCDEVVKRFKAIYPGESLFTIEKPQDSYGSDLYLGDRVRDIFEDNEIFRVIKGAPIRASVEPHRARSQSVQPNGAFQYGSTGPQKRSYGYSEAEELLRAQKRQRIITNDPDHPIRSREHVAVDREAQYSEGHAREATVIQDSQNNTTMDWTGRGINGVRQGITKCGQMKTTQARWSGLDDWRQPNPVATPPAHLQRIPAPETANSSKDEAATSDSDVHLPVSRATSRSKRKLNLIDDFSEQDRGQSTSTAITTPLSVLQQSNNQSPAIDNKKLRRPTIRAGKNNTDDQQVTRPPPRQNVYEVIETDSERPSAKPAPQDISSKLSNSYKWKRYSLSATPNSEQISPRRHRSAVIRKKDMQTTEQMRMNLEAQQQALDPVHNRTEKLAKQQAEQERSRLAFEAAEKRRLDAEEKEKDRQAKVESERVAAEKLRREVEAKKAQAEAEATRKKDALAKAKAANTAQLAEQAKVEAEAKARLEEEERAREASEASKHRLKIDALRKAEKENDLKEQAVLLSRQENRQKSQNLKASLEATVRRAATAPAKAVAAHNGHSATEATSEANEIGPVSNANTDISSNKRITCTPFIPRGRPTGFSPATLHPSQATSSSLPRVPSPNVGLEDQMPMPPQPKRKVSFVDQNPPSGRRSSSTSFTLKQTTLVPPRLGITELKSTPKRTPLKASSNSSKPSKGKAKVVESPRKPPTPTIEISSGEESTTNSSEAETQHNSFKAVGSPGPAYHKPVARQVLSSPKFQMITDVIELDGPDGHRRSVNERETGKTNKESSLSPPKPHTNPVIPASQKGKISSTPETTPSHVRLSIPPHATPSKIKAPQSQGGSSTRSHDSADISKTPEPVRSQETESGHLDTGERSGKIDDDLEEELDSMEPTDTPIPADIPAAIIGRQGDSGYLKGDESEATDEEVEEESDSSEMDNDPAPANVLASASSQVESTHLKADTENETTNGKDQEDPDVGQSDTEDETTDEDVEEFSDAMQAQVDEQLLTQSFESSSSLEQQSSLPKISKVRPPPAAKDVGLLQNHGSGRPSLRRMNLEAQRTKEANLEAAKARGLERAQKMLASAKPNGLLDESSEEASSSELSSTSSEYETDEEELVDNARSMRSGANNIEETHGDLNNEDVEEMSRQLLAKSGDLNGLSSSRASALKSPSRESDLMFRPSSKLQQNGAKKYGKKSVKIGWAKLGKQFSAGKHKSIS